MRIRKRKDGEGREKKDFKNIVIRNWWVFALVLIAVTGFWVRSFPARYGELQALDPFYLFRASEYILTHNFQLLEWDYLRYYPRGVSHWEYEMLVPVYLAPASYVLFSYLGLNMHFLHYAIIFPAILGGLAVFFGFFLGRNLFNSNVAGVFTSFFLATVPAFITRTSAGFFEKEPTAAPLLILTLYFFVKAFRKGSLVYGILSGISLAVLSLAWGGATFIYLVFGSFFALLLVSNAVLVVLDYLFSGFDRALSKMDRYFGMSMIKAYGPAIIIGTVIQSFFPRRSADLTSFYVMFPLLMLAVIVIRYSAERFSFVEKEKVKYLIPGLMVLGVVFLLIGSIFSDYIYKNVSSFFTLIGLERGVIGSTVAENAPGGWGNMATVTGTGFSGLFPQLNFIAPYLSIWVFMWIGVFVLLYELYRNQNWLLLFPLVFLVSSMYGVFYVVRLVYLLGPSSALVAAFLLAWVIKKARDLKYMERFKEAGWKNKINYVTIPLAIFLVLTLLVNFSNAYTYSLGIGPSICFPRAADSSPFNVVPCLTIEDDGTLKFSDNQPWYEAMSFMAKNTSENSVILSWWDFGYWFQTRGQRPSVADGGNIFRNVNEEIADWYTSNTANWSDWEDWMEYHSVDYILMDYTLPGKYGAISKISSDGEQVVGFLQFSQSGIHPTENRTVYEFVNGPYTIWLPFDEGGNLVGTPMFLVSQNGKFVSKSYINDVCTKNGIIRVGEESPSLPGCVALSDYGIYYIPPEAEHTTFVNLMFMDAYGLPVQKVLDNTYIKIYKT